MEWEFFLKNTYSNLHYDFEQQNQIKCFNNSIVSRNGNINWSPYWEENRLTHQFSTVYLIHQCIFIYIY